MFDNAVGLAQNDFAARHQQGGPRDVAGGEYTPQNGAHRASEPGQPHAITGTQEDIRDHDVDAPLRLEHLHCLRFVTGS
jgi:hypothetical protein